VTTSTTKKKSNVKHKESRLLPWPKGSYRGWSLSSIELNRKAGDEEEEEEEDDEGELFEVEVVAEIVVAAAVEAETSDCCSLARLA